MSMRSWSINGYGLSSESISTEEALKVIVEHEYIVRKLDSKGAFIGGEDCSDVKSFYEDYESRTGAYGMLGLVADIIYEKEGICIEYHSGEYDSAIIFPESLPWFYNLVERNITREDVDNLFKRYFPNAKPNFQEIEYYG